MQSALFCAAASDHGEVIVELLKGRANTEIKDSFGKVTKPCPPCRHLNYMVLIVQTPLIEAAFRGKSAIVKILLEHKANIHAKDDDSQVTFLHSECSICR